MESPFQVRPLNVKPRIFNSETKTRSGSSTHWQELCEGNYPTRQEQCFNMAIVSHMDLNRTNVRKPKASHLTSSSPRPFRTHIGTTEHTDCHDMNITTRAKTVNMQGKLPRWWCFSSGAFYSPSWWRGCNTWVSRPWWHNGLEGEKPRAPQWRPNEVTLRGMPKVLID
jgi:hypothetical protein